MASIAAVETVLSHLPRRRPSSGNHAPTRGPRCPVPAGLAFAGSSPLLDLVAKDELGADSEPSLRTASELGALSDLSTAMSLGRATPDSLIHRMTAATGFGAIRTEDAAPRP